MPASVSSTSDKPTSAPKLSAKVQVDGLWFGTIELHEDWVVVSGWTWTGPKKRRLPIEDLTLVEKWTVAEGPNFIFHVNGGRSLRCRIEREAWFWEQAFKKDTRTKLKLRS